MLPPKRNQPIRLTGEAASFYQWLIHRAKHDPTIRTLLEMALISDTHKAIEIPVIVQKVGFWHSENIQKLRAHLLDGEPITKRFIGKREYKALKAYEREELTALLDWAEKHQARYNWLLEDTDHWHYYKPEDDMAELRIQECLYKTFKLFLNLPDDDRNHLTRILKQNPPMDALEGYSMEDENLLLFLWSLSLAEVEMMEALVRQNITIFGL